jgi:UDP-N-acetylglucosamine 2-epimerase (non-hydrolysing)
MRIMSVLGTRPEAIKLAPLLRRLSIASGVESVVCVTGQHREMLEQVNSLFGIVPDVNLDIMTLSQSLTHVTSATLGGLERVLQRYRPDWVVVQGDTSSAFAASLAAFYARTPVAHVEAGLRTGNPYSPWPEEINRRLIACVAARHFAPTLGAKENLIREGIREADIDVTGNTVIDALLLVRDMLHTDAWLAAQQRRHFDFLDPGRRLILVTGHRRENFGGGIERVCRALAQLADRGDVQVVYPVHLNPTVQAAARDILSDTGHVHLLPPLDYLPFVWLMEQSYLIITDSGGVQEEAPSLGKPVLVTRNTTERPEAVAAGTVQLVGTDPEQLLRQTAKLLDEPVAYQAMARAHNPYGDGQATPRIIKRLLSMGSATDAANNECV